MSLAGLTLEIDVAVTQDDARAMASARAGNAASKDKRNLYLVSSASIASSQASQVLPETCAELSFYSKLRCMEAMHLQYLSTCKEVKGKCGI